MKDERGLMTFKKIIIAIILLTFSSSIAICDEKAPAKKRPKKIPSFEKKLPSPFDRWNACDAARKLYPIYNCTSEMIDSERGGVVSTFSIWKNSGKKRLVMLFETYYLEGMESAGAPKVVDIALFDLVNNDLKLTTSLKDALGYRWYGGSQLDLAPYRLNRNEIAIGVRDEPGISGDWGSETLHIYRVEGSSLREIFSREMYGAEYDESVRTFAAVSYSVLEIIPKPSGMNDFKIVTTYYPIEDYQENHNRVLKVTSEIWRWNETTKVYELIK
jgi:hypothetical protein